MTVTSNPRNRKVGGWLALVGAGLMAGAVFAPWIGPGGTGTTAGAKTGWDIHQAATGSQQWYIGNFVSDGFSPFFPGLPILVLAVLVGLAALFVLATAAKISRGTAIALRLIALLAALLAITDPISVMLTGPGLDVLSFKWGMIVVAVGGLLGVLGFALVTAQEGKTTT